MDLFTYSKKITINICISKPDRINIILLHNLASFSIICLPLRRIMLRTIYFYHKTSGCTVKICNK